MPDLRTTLPVEPPPLVHELPTRPVSERSLQAVDQGYCEHRTLRMEQPYEASIRRSHALTQAVLDVARGVMLVLVISAVSVATAAGVFWALNVLFGRV